MTGFTVFDPSGCPVTMQSLITVESTLLRASAELVSTALASCHVTP